MYSMHMKSLPLYSMELEADYSKGFSSGVGAIVAQSVGTWLGNRRVAGSSPARTTQYGVWTGSWRGASSPPGHY